MDPASDDPVTPRPPHVPLFKPEPDPDGRYIARLEAVAVQLALLADECWPAWWGEKTRADGIVCVMCGRHGLTLDPADVAHGEDCRAARLDAALAALRDGGAA